MNQEAPDSQSESGSESPRPRRRGRPRLSRASWLLYKDDVLSFGGRVIFPHLDEYNMFIENEIQRHHGERKTSLSEPAFIKLKEGTATAKALLLQHQQKLQAESQIGLDIEVPSRLESKMEEIGVRNELHALLQSGHLDVQPREDLCRHPRHLANEILALRLRLLERKRLRFVSQRTSLTPSQISRLCRKASKSPRKLMERLRKASVHASAFVDGTSEQITERISEGSVLMTNRRHAASVLRSYLKDRLGQSDRLVLARARAELGLKKVRPKILRGTPKTIFPQEELSIFDQLLRRFFFHDKSMLIFDCTSFQNHKAGLTVWSLPKVRPYVKAPSLLGSVHLLTLISVHGVEACQLVKCNLDTTVIGNFLLASLYHLTSDLRRDRRWRYMVLDNAPSHTIALVTEIHARYGIVSIFNFPRNPSHNPIEILFGALKAKYRCEAACRSDTAVDLIISSLRRIVLESFSATMRYCYSILFKNIVPDRQHC